MIVGMSFLTAGFTKRAYQTRLIRHLTVSGLKAASPFHIGAGEGGSLAQIHVAGSNGIAAIIWGAA